MHGLKLRRVKMEVRQGFVYNSIAPNAKSVRIGLPFYFNYCYILILTSYITIYIERAKEGDANDNQGNECISSEFYTKIGLSPDEGRAQKERARSV